MTTTVSDYYQIIWMQVIVLVVPKVAKLQAKVARGDVCVFVCKDTTITEIVVYIKVHIWCSGAFVYLHFRCFDRNICKAHVNKYFS